MNIFKKISVPNDTKEIISYEKWSVRWTSTNYYNKHNEAEFFTTEKDANEFLTKIKDAFKLTKVNIAENNFITVKKE